MLYETVYDISDIGFRFFWLPAAGAAIAFIGLLIACAPVLAVISLPSRWYRGSPRMFGIVIFVLGIFWTAASFAVINAEYLSLVRAFEEGNYKVVEGPVQNFHPMPFTPNGTESFEVGGLRFEYSDFELKDAHITTTVHAGPIEDGLFVRVAYTGNKILRLEIRK